jgi:AraC-like DNA-binding protein
MVMQSRLEYQNDRLDQATDLEAINLEIVRLLGAQALKEGTWPTTIPGVEIIRVDQPRRREALFHEAGILFVASGVRRLYMCDRIVTCDSQNYLLSTVPLHFECETIPEQDHPLLAVWVRLDLQLLSELAFIISETREAIADQQIFVTSVPHESALSCTVARLLQVLQSPSDARALGPGIVRELIYRILCGAEGPALIGMLGRNGIFSRLLPAIQHIHQHYAEDLDVTSLARKAGMSVSGFHLQFKTMTTTSPLQLLKDVRLSRARMLMVHDLVPAATAALRVGYESSSQFNREFKRHFGRTPQQEVARLRSELNIASSRMRSLHPHLTTS